MISIAIEQWRPALIECGDLSEDHPTELLEKRVHRYCELVDMVDGSEGADVFYALLDSIRDESDTEVYESTYNALWRFPPEKFALFFSARLSQFIERYGEDSARFLLGLTGEGKDIYLPEFNKVLALIPAEEQKKIVAYIEAQEKGDGWFDGTAGYIKPLVSSSGGPRMEP